MKKFVSLIIGGVVIGFVFFAILYWVMGVSYENSIIAAFSASVAGIGVEYSKPLIYKITGNTPKE